MYTYFDKCLSHVLYLNKIVSAAATWQPHVFDAFAASGENQKWYSNRIAIYNILNLWRENREKHSFVHSETYYIIILKTTVNGSRHNCIWCLNDFGFESDMTSYIIRCTNIIQIVIEDLYSLKEKYLSIRILNLERKYSLLAQKVIANIHIIKKINHTSVKLYTTLQ